LMGAWFEVLGHEGLCAIGRTGVRPACITGSFNPLLLHPAEVRLI
jgi:hypothetical protein